MTASYRIIDGAEVPPEYLKSVCETAKSCFTEKDCLPEEQCLAWHFANNEIFTVAVNNETNGILFCMGMIPVALEYYEKIKKGELEGKVLPAEAIVKYDKMGSIDLYLSAIAVSPVIKNKAVLRSMIDAAGKKLLAFASKGILCRRVVTVAQSKEAEKLYERLKMKKIGEAPDGAAIFEISMLPPDFRPLTKSMKELYSVYKSFAEAIMMEKMIKGRMRHE